MVIVPNAADPVTPFGGPNCVVLNRLNALVGAGLAIRGFQQLTKVDAGFDPANVFEGRVDLPASRYGTTDSGASIFTSSSRARLVTIPGVHDRRSDELALSLGGAGSSRESCRTW